MEFAWFGENTGKYCSPRRIDNYSFVYIEYGYGDLKINKNYWRIREGDLFVLFPDEIHEYCYDAEAPWNLWWFGIAGDEVEALLQQIGITRENPVLTKLQKTEIPASLKRLVFLLDNKSLPGSFFALSEFYTFIGHVSQYNTYKNMKDTLPYNRIQQSIRFMELNYAFPVDTDKIANHTGYTRTYYSYLFKTITGKSPIEYLTQIRLKRASELLTQTCLTVSEISNSVGYQDPFYFSKLFKKHYGMNPSEFRAVK